MRKKSGLKKWFARYRRDQKAQIITMVVSAILFAIYYLLFVPRGYNSYYALIFALIFLIAEWCTVQLANERRRKRKEEAEKARRRRERLNSQSR